MTTPESITAIESQCCVATARSPTLTESTERANGYVCALKRADFVCDVQLDRRN